MKSIEEEKTSARVSFRCYLLIFYKIFKNTFYIEQFQMTASDLPQDYNKPPNLVFHFFKKFNLCSFVRIDHKKNLVTEIVPFKSCYTGNSYFGTLQYF